MSRETAGLPGPAVTADCFAFLTGLLSLPPVEPLPRYQDHYNALSMPGLALPVKNSLTLILTKLYYYTQLPRNSPIGRIFDCFGRADDFDPGFDVKGFGES